MTGTVLISTHRLPVAGRLKAAFEAEEIAVDLTPEPDHLGSVADPVLLILTGETGQSPLERWVDEARALDIPVFASLPDSAARRRAERLGVEEILAVDPDAEEVALLGERTVERRRLQEITGIVGESEAMREALERIVQIAPVDSTVLITGESGTGKELAARGIHALSPRRHRAFLAVNVAAVSETLLESELFGHEKGAFTGAIDSRKGFFELADRGTLFLDEIGEMPLSTQTKLLRVLEQREFLRVGGEESIRVDVRIIAATNQDLRDLVATGRFRRDLFYRLNVLGIELPPLRRRREDVPRLVNHFVRELSERLDRQFPGITDEAMALLVRYDWPGNVRELRNLVESMVVLAPRNAIGPDDVPSQIRHPHEGARLLPAPAGSPPATVSAGSGGEDDTGRHIRPELEFIFRTLVELRVDMDELKRDFDLYRHDLGGVLDRSGEVQVALPYYEGGEVGTQATRSTDGGIHDRPSGGHDVLSEGSDGPLEGGGGSSEGPESHRYDGADGVETETADGVVFQPGMTMDDLEEEAIRVTLQRTDGNRRKAAESLGIGERTLYRKIRKYGIED